MASISASTPKFGTKRGTAPESDALSSEIRPVITAILLLLLTFPLSAVAAGTGSAGLSPATDLPESGLDFRGAEDQPLALDENALLDFLRTAPITHIKVLETGINNTRKLTLERDGVKAHAVFRTVNQSTADTVGSTRPNRFGFRDCYLFEVAAYRLSRMLGIHRVPPAVLRSIDGERGSVQLWIENSTTAADAIEKGIATRAPALFHQQRQLMFAFDQLVFNFDRHHGNILYDQRDRLWFIDHTRSFKRLPRLSEEHRPVISDRQFYQGLSALDPADVKTQMKGILSKIEVDALLRRRVQLLRHFDDLIQKYGRDSVLMDVNRTIYVGDDASAAGTVASAR